jgi:hypothetical protein
MMHARTTLAMMILLASSLLAPGVLAQDGVREGYNTSIPESIMTPVTGLPLGI